MRPAPAAALDGSTPEAARPLCVLVVDDHAAVREGLARLISAAGAIVVHTAASSVEALRLLQQIGAHVVVLDVDLAGDDGLALLPALLPRARVLVLTSHADPATRTRALHLGAEAFVEKNEPAAVLLGHLARLASPRAGGEASPGWPGASSPAASGAMSVSRTRPTP